MKFYKKANGEWVVDRYTIPAGSCTKDEHPVTGAITIESMQSGKIYADSVLPTDFEYPDPENAGQFLKYANEAAFNAAIEGFFFRNSGIGTALINGFLMIPDAVTGLRFRIGARNSQYVIDKELTVTGFSGTQSIDDGLTGDWINIGGAF